MNLMNFGVMPVKIRVCVWVHKEKNGIIYAGSYESDTGNYKVCDNAGHVNVRGAVQTIEDMIKNILEQAKCNKATWLIRMNSSENKKSWTKEEVDIVKKLDRWGCIADDYDLYGNGTGNQTKPNHLYDEFEVILNKKEEDKK